MVAEDTPVRGPRHFVTIWLRATFRNHLTYLLIYLLPPPPHYYYYYYYYYYSKACDVENRPIQLEARQ